MHIAIIGVVLMGPSIAPVICPHEQCREIIIIGNPRAGSDAILEMTKELSIDCLLKEARGFSERAEEPPELVILPQEYFLYKRKEVSPIPVDNWEVHKASSKDFLRCKEINPTKASFGNPGRFAGSKGFGHTGFFKR